MQRQIAPADCGDTEVVAVEGARCARQDGCRQGGVAVVAVIVVVVDNLEVVDREAAAIAAAAVFVVAAAAFVMLVRVGQGVGRGVAER